MSKKTKEKIKIWWIKDEGGVGYWSEVPEVLIHEFEDMDTDGAFTITVQELTVREFNKLKKSSHEFDGW